MRNRRYVLSALALLVATCVACSGEARDRCVADQDAVLDWLRTELDLYSPVRFGSDVKLAQRRGRPPGQRGALIVVSPTGIRSRSGVRSHDPGDLGELARMIKNGPLPVQLAIDPAALWGDIASLIESIQLLGVIDVELLFDAGEATLPAAAEARTSLADAEAYVRSCPRAVRDGLSADVYRDGPWKFYDGVERAVRACPCPLPRRSIESLLWIQIGRPARRLASVRVLLAPLASVPESEPLPEDWAIHLDLENKTWGEIAKTWEPPPLNRPTVFGVRRARSSVPLPKRR